MSDEEIPPFPDFDAISALLDEKTTRLMDVNYMITQNARDEIQRLNVYQERLNAYLDSMKEALAIGAKLFAEFNSEMISDEFQIVMVGDEPEEDDDDDS